MGYLLVRENASPSPTGSFYLLLTLHSLSWLAVGNAVGLLLAVLLLAPSLNDLLGPLTYGRWVPVHLNIQLYGWCSMPLLGLLFLLFVPRSTPSRSPGWAVQAWSGALLFGCLSWLAGHSSGKVFLEWQGAALLLFSANLLFLAGVLIQAYYVRSREELRDPSWNRMLSVAKWITLLALAAVPFGIYGAASPAVYPSVNPDTGGPTGAGLVVSTLGLIPILLAFPLVLGLKPRGSRYILAVPILVWVGNTVFYGLIGHGDHSHHDILQIAGMASLLVWGPLLYGYLKRYSWPESSRPWVAAFCAWGAFLLLTAVGMFLPGPLDRWKFTNALVGHTHAAMAGMLSAFCMILLTNLLKPVAPAVRLDARSPFIRWQVGTALQVVVLMLLGTREGTHARELFLSGAFANVAYVLRLVGGLLMFSASIDWLRGVYAAYAALKISTAHTIRNPEKLRT